MADERYADLADLLLALSRTISAEAHADPRVIELTASEVNVMRCIDRNPGISPSAVAAATGLQRSNLSRALRDLEAKGMVERTADAADGRHTRLAPTPRATENLRRLRATWTRMLTAALDDDSHLDATLELLSGLEDGLNRSR